MLCTFIVGASALFSKFSKFKLKSGCKLQINVYARIVVYTPGSICTVAFYNQN